MTDSNLKVRTLAEEIFVIIFQLMRCQLNAINNLFTIILVGLAGTNQSTQSSTIRCLIFSIKQNILHRSARYGSGENQGAVQRKQVKEETMNDDDDDEFENDEDNQDASNRNKLPSDDYAFQQFLVKATRIITLFLKDKNTRHELARSVLLFTRLASNMLTTDYLKTQMAATIIQALFPPQPNATISKHRLLLRKVITKLLKRCGTQLISALLPPAHRPIITYIERVQRKQQNKVEKAKLRALLGSSLPDSETQKSAIDDLDESSSDESGDEVVDQQVGGPEGREHLGEMEDDVAMGEGAVGGEEEDDSEEEQDDGVGQAGGDRLQATGIDIPRVDDIPVVSRLSRKSEKEKMEEMNEAERVEYKLNANRENVNKMMKNDDYQLETHFVENPYIRLREKAQ